MTFGTYDTESACSLNLFNLFLVLSLVHTLFEGTAELDIGTTAGHVGSDGNSTVTSCFRYYLSFHLMELGI